MRAKNGIGGNLVFYTRRQRLKEGNGTGEPKEPAGERKVKIKRGKIHRKGEDRKGFPIHCWEYYNCMSQFFT